MFDLLAVIPIVGSVVHAIKEANQPVIPAENWANRELYHNDIMNGASDEQLMKNVENGRYKLSKKHPEPHREHASGKIVIENCDLYFDDLMNYGAIKTQKWLEQGKYNMTHEEMRKERKRVKEKYDKMLGLI